MLLLLLYFSLSAGVLSAPPKKSTTLATTKVTTTPTTTTTTTAKWLNELDDDIVGCYGGKDTLFQVYSDYKIDSTLTNFFSYFTAFLPVSNVPTAKGCCLKCSAPGRFSTCIAFDYDVQAQICQMYAVKTEEAFYYVFDNKFSYNVAVGQPEFLTGYGTNVSYIVPFSSRYSGIILRGYGTYKVIY